MTTGNENNQNKPYKLGLALSGGGARGVAHAGALKALEEAGLKPDIIAGVSAGSIVGVLYAAGVAPDEILKMFIHSKFSDFTDFAFIRGGLFRIEKFVQYVMGKMPKFKRLEELPIPTYVGVTNFDDGTPEEFHEGEIADIVRASCSIPVAIPPVEIDGKTYVDGGVLRNLPAWTIRDKCQTLIGINVSPMSHYTPSNSIVDIALRTYTLLAKSNQTSDMEMCDLTVCTREISHCKVFSLRDVQKIFLSGYANTRKTLRDAGWWPEPNNNRNKK